jgi:hypothetical protein
VVLIQRSFPYLQSQTDLNPRFSRINYDLEQSPHLYLSTIAPYRSGR